MLTPSTRIARRASRAAALATAAVATAVACGSSGGGSTGSPAPAATSAPAASAPAASAPAGGGNAATATETEFSIALSTQTFTAGSVTFTAVNKGSITHALTVNGPGVDNQSTGDISPGASKTLTVTLQKGSYDVYCPVDDHKGMGMDVHVTVN